MKKFLTAFFLIGIIAFVSCGPNEEERQKMEDAERAKMDSIMQLADSLLTDTIAQVADTASMK